MSRRGPNRWFPRAGGRKNTERAPFPFARGTGLRVASGRMNSAREDHMAIKRIDVTEGPGTRMSKCVVNGNMAYLAGLVADDAAADIKTQTQQVLNSIDHFLKQAGTDKSKLLQANVWLTDLGNYNAMNEVWNAWVDPKNPPARACVQAQLARKGLLVEIMVTAAI